MWQIAAICLAAVVLGINAAVTSYNSANPVPALLMLVVFLFALAFVCLTVYVMYWLRVSILSRVVFLRETEEKTSRIKGEDLVSRFGGMLRENDAPLKMLLVFFLVLAAALVIPVIHFAAIVLGPVLTPENAVTVSTVMVSVLLVITQFVYSVSLRRREKEVFSPVVSGSKLEQMVHDKLELFAKEYDYALESGNSWHTDFVLSKPGATILVEVRVAKLPMTRGYDQLILSSMQYDSLKGGQSLLVLVTPGAAAEEINRYGRTVFHIGYDSDFKAIAEWAARLPKGANG